MPSGALVSRREPGAVLHSDADVVEHVLRLALPGDWPLIGQTDAVLWDTDRPRPALIRPGARVQFVAVRELIRPRSEFAGDVPAESRITPGPRDDWFDEDALRHLRAGEWTVTAQSNRIGLRLNGPALDRIRTGELPSEGTVKGALQIPPSGLPVLFLADHPVTGWYPVIAVVVSADLDRAAQLPPGSSVRFREMDPCDDQDAQNFAVGNALETVVP